MVSDVQSDGLDYDHSTYMSDEGNVTTQRQAANEIKGILEDLGVNELL